MKKDQSVQRQLELAQREYQELPDWLKEAVELECRDLQASDGPLSGRSAISNGTPSGQKKY